MKDSRIRKNYWVARDKNGLLCAFNAKPIIHENVFIRSGMGSMYIVIPEEYKILFGFVTWENSPIKITIIKD